MILNNIQQCLRDVMIHSELWYKQLPGRFCVIYTIKVLKSKMNQCIETALNFRIYFSIYFLKIPCFSLQSCGKNIFIDWISKSMLLKTGKNILGIEKLNGEYVEIMVQFKVCLILDKTRQRGCLRVPAGTKIVPAYLQLKI